MVRLGLVVALFVIACLMSGVYGALHNQISYTISPEYFTEFKFEQFQISPILPPRTGAAIVGWQASWWMGIVIGIFVIPFGLLIRDSRIYFFRMIFVFGLILLTTIVIGLLGLAASYFVVTPETAQGFLFRDQQLKDPVGFLRAGTLHNASYFGGLVGIIVGMVSILKRFLYLETASSKI